MTEDSFLLVNLKDEKSKKLAQVITNETSRKILAHLSEHKEGTETDMAKVMGLPISTVHYNLQHLVQSGLVDINEFHYSQKGKEVNHYVLSNKIVIIAPKTTETMLQKLKKIFPIVLITIGVAAIIQIIQMQITRTGIIATQTYAEAGPVIDRASQAVQTEMLSKAAPAAARADQTISAATSTASWTTSIAAWFLIGAVTALATLVIYEKIKDKRI